MKRTLISSLREGMIVAEDVRLNGNQVFLREGTELTPSIIATLGRTNLVFIKVYEPEDKSASEEELTHMGEIAASDEFEDFQNRYRVSMKKLSQFMEELAHEGKLPDLSDLMDDIWKLAEERGQTYSILDYLLSMRDYDDSTFGHSINVALMCGIFADWLNMSKEEQETAFYCGLFHDIGKLKIPVSILRKPGKLTLAEFDQVKKHSIYGYEILSHPDLNNVVGDHVRNSALMHHERTDGTGYPFGLRGEKLDYYSKMVAIVDVFDAMTSERVYRKAICPFKVIAHFERVGYQKYDAQMLMTFLEHITGRYMNYSVRLNTGTVGKIVFLNRASLSKPMIKCGDEYLDLSKESEVYIESVF